MKVYSIQLAIYSYSFPLGKMSEGQKGLYE